MNKNGSPGMIKIKQLLLNLYHLLLDEVEHIVNYQNQCSFPEAVG